ncbi:MAG: AEC family transporter, partial [Dermatophilaceae bacterium]|nr:AEC family transporter [Dermatophilaceae bacterium]
VQLLLFTPISMTILDSQMPGAKPGFTARVAGLFRNPITVGAIVGLVISLTGITIPELVMAPLTLVGNLAVPGMLIAFGISLRLGQKPGQDFDRIAVITGLKLIVQPLAAIGIALLLGIRGQGVLVAAVMAALPTAQNIFTYSLRYDRAIFLTRDAIFVTTFGSIPVILVAAAFLS